MVKKEVLSVNWRASKEPLARFIRAVYDRMPRAGDSFYREIPEHGVPVEGLIYDLGHNGRGFDEFPYTVALEVSNPHEIPLPYSLDTGLEVDMSVADLVRQIKSQIEDFVMSHPFAQNNPKPYEASMKTLDVLAQRAGNQKVKIIFGTDYGNNREIESLQISR